MSNTANLQLPLVMAAQAQKHVTVNAALARLDASVQTSLLSLTQQTPPATAAEGAVYGVPAGATGLWAGFVGQLAVYSNGGWDFVTPKTGWRGWVVDLERPVLFNGVDWVPDAVAVSPNGAASLFQIIEADIANLSGSSVFTADIIPAGCVVFGVTGIVTSALTGTASSWRIGVPTGLGQYGTGLGMSLGSWLKGLSGQPQAFYSPTPVVIEAEGGSFTGGDIRVAIHVFAMNIPRV